MMLRHSPDGANTRTNYFVLTNFNLILFNNFILHSDTKYCDSLSEVAIYFVIRINSIILVNLVQIFTKLISNTVISIALYQSA